MLDLDAPGRVSGTPSKEAQRLEEEAYLRLGMELLDPEDRRILVLRQWDGLSFGEIGQQMGLSAEAAWMRHSRAIQRLSKKVGRLRRGDLSFLVEEVDEAGEEEASGSSA